MSQISAQLKGSKKFTLQPSTSPNILSMRLLVPAAVLLFCVVQSSAFSLPNIFGTHTQIDTADGVPPETAASAETVNDPAPKKKLKHKKKKKPHHDEDEIEEFISPVDVDGDLEPTSVEEEEEEEEEEEGAVDSSGHKKPTKHKKKKKTKKTGLIKHTIKKVKKVKEIKKKKIAFFTHLAKPFLTKHKKKPVPTKKPVKKKPCKTKFIEIKKKKTVHPVCFITLKKKSPCLKPGHDEYSEQEVAEYGHGLEFEENMGEVNEEGSYDYWPWNTRDAKGLSLADDNATLSENMFESHPVDQFEDLRVYDVQAAGKDGELTRLSYTVDVPESQEEDISAEELARKKRYIDFIDPPEVESSEDGDDVSLESSEEDGREDADVRTVLVTRIERYTNSKVEGTLIAKNCMPVHPNVPPCKKKKKKGGILHAVIRERPDSDGPLVIDSTPVQGAVPPEVKFEGKDTIDDSEAQESEATEVAAEAAGEKK